MIAAMFALLFFTSGQSAQPSSQPAAASPQVQTPSQPTPSQSPPATDKPKFLARVHRIYVESFGDDPISQQMQAMVISSLTGSQRFVVTEEKSKADAVLKGAATQKSSQEVHAYGSGTAVGAARGSASGFGAAESAIQDSSVNTESTENAHASVRLVNTDGDVIWTTTQESNGAKFKGASADVADKIAKQLVRDAEKAEKATADKPATK
jgi:curli biogenesis system outer membrane secretion channel CsgG